MRWLLILFLLAGSIFTSNAQEPVRWQYTLSQKGPKTYEIKAVATLQEGWHIYSTTTPAGGPAPTRFQFTKNPLLLLKGTVQERGQKIKKYEDVFDVDTEYYNHKVSFVQAFERKANAKTSISGTVTYMVCSEERCLPPTTQSFRLPVQ